MSEVVAEKKALRPAEDSTEWVELASRSGDKLMATLHTLGGEALAQTLSMVTVEHANGVYLTRQGPLEEVAKIYTHPMVYMSDLEALTAYPPTTEAA